VSQLQEKGSKDNYEIISPEKVQYISGLIS